MPTSFWKWLRRGSQWAALAFVIFIVVKTTYPLTLGIDYELVPKFSPLLTLTTIIAARTLPAAALYAGAVVALTLVFGRAFCGWLCPLGTALDGTDFLIGRLVRRRTREGAKPSHRHYRYALAVAVIVAAALGVNLAGWFDPLALVPRTLSAAVIPYCEIALDQSTRLFYSAGGDWQFISDFRQKYLPTNVAVMPGHWVIISFLILILLLNLIRRRFYCRYVCPTGAVLSLISWATPFGRRVSSGCVGECKHCRNLCRMGAITENGVGTATSECTLCTDCLTACRRGVVSFGFGRKRPDTAETNWAPVINRRSFFIAAGAGLAAAPAVSLSGSGTPPPIVIRPPGGQNEEEFLTKCVRCGECIRVCLTQGLVPAMFEAGPAGLWTPRFAMRKGYCEYRCTLCTSVCPTDALRPLSEAEKKRTFLGIAVISRDRCLPWATGEECNVCEEMCPTSPKAIVLRGRGLPKPHVVADRCVGCGICEYTCPVQGKAAIRVFNNSVRNALLTFSGRKRYRRGRGGI